MSSKAKEAPASPAKLVSRNNRILEYKKINYCSSVRIRTTRTPKKRSPVIKLLVQNLRSPSAGILHNLTEVIENISDQVIIIHCIIFDRSHESRVKKVGQ